jgi:hypothetical protein
MAPKPRKGWRLGRVRPRKRRTGLQGWERRSSGRSQAVRLECTAVWAEIDGGIRTGSLELSKFPATGRWRTDRKRGPE